MDDAIRPSGAKCAAHGLRVESVRDQGLGPEGVKLVGPRAGTGGPRDLVASFDEMASCDRAYDCYNNLDLL